MGQEYHEVYASAARTASPDDVMITVRHAEGAYAVIDCTAATATPSVVFTFDLYDPASGKTVNLLTTAAITGTGTTTIRIDPHLTAAGGTVAKEHVPPYLVITATHADADSITYSVGLHLV